MQQPNSIARIQKYSQKVIRAFTTPKSYRLGLAPYRQKNWSAALQLFERAISESANHADSHFKLGMCHFRQKNYEQAKATMERALTLSPERTEWKDQLNQTLRHLGKAAPSSAASQEERIRKELETNPNDAELYNKLAHALRKQGKWWQEVDALTRATELKPEDPTWFYRLGEALEAMNRYQQAAEAYGKAIALKNGKAEAQWYYRQGYCYAREGHDGPADTVKADKAYRTAIEKDTKLKAKRFGIGVFHQQRGHWPQAKEKYQKTLANQPWDAELNYRLGMAHDRCYEWAEAESCYKKALTIDKQQTYWHYRLGFVLERQEKFADAALAYQYAAIHRDQHTPYWFYRWGYVLEQQGKYAEAVQAFLQTRQQQTLDKSEELIEELESIQEQVLDNGSGESGNAQPATDPLCDYAQQFDNQQFVIEALTQHLEQDTTNPEHWYQLGNVYERQQQWEKAAEAYGHAVARQNDHKPEWYYRLGYALAQCDKFQPACEALRDTRILQKAYGVSKNKFNKDAGFRQAATYTEYYEGLDIRPKTVLYESFHGASMSCNPYALFLYLLEQPEYRDWTHVWVVNDLEKIQDKFKNNKNIIFVARDSDAYMRYIASTSHLLNNNTFPPYFIRKDNQLYLNTWHGTPWKTLGIDIKSGFQDHKNVSRNFLQTTHIISPNPHTTKILTERHDVKDILSAKVYETGYPRIDLTLNCNAGKRNNIIDILSLKSNKKTILYAPTYRGSSLGVNNTNEISEISNLVKKLSSIKEFNVIFRAHHMLEKEIESMDLSLTLAPSTLDTNEILAVVDILVTDYSSILFDFLPTKKPIVLFAFDYDEYVHDRGLYFAIDTLPFKAVKNVDDCITQIRNADDWFDSKYNNEVERKYTPHETGSVSKKVVDIFFKKQLFEQVKFDNNSKKRILVYVGAFVPNGITVSFQNLITSIDLDAISVSIGADVSSISNHEDRLQQFSYVHDYVNLLGRVGQLPFSIEEKWTNDIYLKNHCLYNCNFIKTLETLYSREFKRLYGHVKFDVIVNFEGYVRFWTMLFGLSNSFNAKKSIYLHNDMIGEYRERFPNLKSNFSLYEKYDSLISVSKSTNNLNKENLTKSISIDEIMFKSVDNLLNPDLVVTSSIENNIPANELEIMSTASPLFINMARLSVEKGHENLLNAFKRIVAIWPLSKLIILGEGPLREKLIQQIIELALERHVYLFGRKSNPFSYLKRSNCFVFSSKYEGQGLVLLESMMLGVPIVCTDFPCAHDVLQNGKYGLIVENSANGLYEGMKTFLEHGIQVECFDSYTYQREALEDFYKNVCGETK